MTDAFDRGDYCNQILTAWISTINMDKLALGLPRSWISVAPAFQELNDTTRLPTYNRVINHNHAFTSYNTSENSRVSSYGTPSAPAIWVGWIKVRWVLILMRPIFPICKLTLQSQAALREELNKFDHDFASCLNYKVPIKILSMFTCRMDIDTVDNRIMSKVDISMEQIASWVTIVILDSLVITPPGFKSRIHSAPITSKSTGFRGNNQCSKLGHFPDRVTETMIKSCN